MTGEIVDSTTAVHQSTSLNTGLPILGAEFLVYRDAWHSISQPAGNDQAEYHAALLKSLALGWNGVPQTEAV